MKQNKSHHYGSSSFCYSFGIRNAFSKYVSGDITVTKYARDGIMEMAMYKKYIWRKVMNLFKCFDSIIGVISSKLYLSCKLYKKITRKNPEMNVVLSDDECLCSRSTFISGNINVNANAKYLHSELDSTYTTILVPNQGGSSNFILFEFLINEQNSLKIKFGNNSGLTYSAYCLSHRQYLTQGENCMNISTYSGKRVFCSYRKSSWGIRNKKKKTVLNKNLN